MRLTASNASNSMSRNSAQIEMQSAFRGNLQQWNYRLDSNETDIRQVLLDFKETLLELLTASLLHLHAIKIALLLTIEYRSKKNPTIHLIICICEVQPP